MSTYTLIRLLKLRARLSKTSSGLMVCGMWDVMQKSVEKPTKKPAEYHSFRMACMLTSQHLTY